MSGSASSKCVVCKSSTMSGLSSWHFQCSQCGYEGTSLTPTINDSVAHERVDEGNREKALRSLRKSSFELIVSRIRSYVPGGSLLDVGSAHGWFLDEAAPYFKVLGLEPDQAVFEKAYARGVHVKNGYFPDALDEGESFDVIVFNDVIEHIPEIGQALQAVHQRLNAGGILVLNLPNSRGFFYRLSKFMMRFGFSGPFERMWQKGLPSPHVHYFDSKNLKMLVERNGFSLMDNFELPSLRSDGLLERIRYVGKGGAVTTYVQYVILRATIPFLRMFPSDITVCMFRKV